VSLLICSFYSGAPYYYEAAERLKNNLTELNVSHKIIEIPKVESEDWADICRKKITFLAEQCRLNPDKKVFWIDVDCTLYSIPDFIKNSTADFIAFQRGFSSPSLIGYGSRSRFWEPCFYGINATSNGRKMIFDASDLESNLAIKATDDFFLEEAWKLNSNNLTFQVIPSNTAAFRGSRNENSKEIFFEFGSSGQVENFKKKVIQHKSAKKNSLKYPKRLVLNFVKVVEERLPEKINYFLRNWSDHIGLTGYLTGHKHSPEKNRTHINLMKIAKSGELELFKERELEIRAKGIGGEQNLNFLRAANSFAIYASGEKRDALNLAWWADPKPGNYGDWLSPLIFKHYSNRPIRYQNLTTLARNRHIVGVGSVGRFIKRNSIVVGTGVSSKAQLIEPNAKYVSLRGPLTAELLLESGGKKIDSFGDPALVLSRIFPKQRDETNGMTALIRHHSHRQAPIFLSENMDELSVLASSPVEIEKLIDKLIKYRNVVTSAMHIYITCQVYGIPVSLISFEGFEDSVHGDGLKYKDYALGADMPVITPKIIDRNLRKINLDDLTTTSKISEAKVNEVENSILEGINQLFN
jgi:hypothetical protein